MNLNLHANFLLALIKLCGLEPGMDALHVCPRVPVKQWSLTLPCLRLDADHGALTLRPAGPDGALKTHAIRAADSPAGKFTLSVENAERP